jgi:hypothetical protein
MRTDLEVEEFNQALASFQCNLPLLILITLGD